MFFASHPDRSRWCVLLLFLCLSASALHGVTLELGREGEVLQHEVEAPNLTTSSATMPPWNPSSSATSILKVEPGVAPLSLPGIGELLIRFKDLIATHATVVASDPQLVIPLKDILGASEPFVHTGVGTSEKTARNDGPASVEVFLPTYNPATIEVRVINPDNTEVLYSGESLLYWMRPNDKAKALVKFQGAEQPDSMYLNKAGDWSANPKKYEFDVKANQRVILSISGAPLSSAYVRVTGNVF